MGTVWGRGVGHPNCGEVGAGGGGMFPLGQSVGGCRKGSLLVVEAGVVKVMGRGWELVKVGYYYGVLSVGGVRVPVSLGGLQRGGLCGKGRDVVRVGGRTGTDPIFWWARVRR